MSRDARLLTAAIFLPALCALGIILSLGQNVPWADDWFYLPVVRQMNEGTLTASQLLAWHNVHRPALVRILMLALAWPTRLNMVALMLVSWSIAACLLAILLERLRACEAARDRPIGLWLVTLASAFVFTPAQYDNWLWATQVQMFLAVALAALAFRLLDTTRESWPCLAAAALASIAAALSSGAGFGAMPAGLAVLAARGRSRRQMGAWIALGALAFALNGAPPLAGWNGPLAPRDLAGFVKVIGVLIAFPGGAAGAGVSLQIALGLGIWIVIAAAIAQLRKRGELDKAAFWIGAVLLVLWCASTTAWSRAAIFGLGAAGASRYVTLSALAPTAAAVLAACAWGTGGQMRARLLACLLLALTLGAAAGYAIGIRDALRHHEGIARFADCVRTDTAGQRTGCLDKYGPFFPPPTLVRREAAYLKSLGWAGFR